MPGSGGFSLGARWLVGFGKRHKPFKSTEPEQPLHLFGFAWDDLQALRFLLCTSQRFY